MYDCTATWSPVFLNYNLHECVLFILRDFAWKMLVSIHILVITNRLDDSYDIYSRQCNLIGQTNSMLCYFRDLDSVIKAKLMKCYCFGMYSCVLWDFNNAQVESFCKAWHKGMRRCFDLPYDSHSFILPALSHTLPPFHEMCERFARFITKSMYGSSALVQSVVTW